MKLYKSIGVGMIVIMLSGWFAVGFAKIKCVPKIYAFGFSASFNDSIVYFTDVQEIDSVWINDKNKFLIGRDNYSYQLKNYFSRNGMEHRTCIISYAFNRKDIEKKYQKMRNKYIKAAKYAIGDVKSSEFHFTAIKPDEYQIETAKR